ncbi:hypothetical protein AT15_00810 [Kosmotoga arenicorallina S304]|uniref:Peptidoglycan glycosyltransferase n=1 Tax=Kosmotoga arenicorallina S304 TaxID=1453497 RepID=A0A176K108_9BACT|nr:penicillin-binding protein 2 [Kosmotoga arenicorallina]OAA30086.1 hypothetical protein AT15_00810 [Kosmotoga arenicorallina S304]
MNFRRSDLLIIAFFVIVAVYLFRLVELQLIQHDKYQSEVDMISTKTIELPAERGKILDRNGIILAWNSRYQIIRKKVTFFSEYTKTKLLDAFSEEENPEKILKTLEVTGEVTLHLSPDKLYKAGEIDEIEIITKSARRYIQNPGISHVLGYVNSEGIPQRGIEKEYNYLLTGKPGERVILINSLGEAVYTKTEIPPQKGIDVKLTLDASLSFAIYNIFADFGKPGAAVVMSNSGEILALVSYPSYDPNLFPGGISSENWEKLRLDPQSPLLNRAINSYSPGSVVKPFVSMVALKTGVTPDATLNCTGSYQFKDSRGHTLSVFRDWYLYGHGIVDLKQAITVSCNVYFYQLGLLLGIENLSKYARMWEVFDKTGIDLPTELSGVFPDPQWKLKNYAEQWYPGDTILSSIGQGYVLATPLEIARLTEIIANRGIVYKPHLFAQETPPATVVEMPSEYWDVLIEAMEQVVTEKGHSPADEGTAYQAFAGFEYEVAGKTGTAETNSAPHSWFTGFSPVKKPQIIVTVFVENGGYGSTVAAPIARKIFDCYYDQ